MEPYLPSRWTDEFIWTRNVKEDEKSEWLAFCAAMDVAGHSRHYELGQKAAVWLVVRSLLYPGVQDHVATILWHYDLKHKLDSICARVAYSMILLLCNLA